MYISFIKKKYPYEYLWLKKKNSLDAVKILKFESSAFEGCDGSSECRSHGEGCSMSEGRIMEGKLAQLNEQRLIYLATISFPAHTHTSFAIYK